MESNSPVSPVNVLLIEDNAGDIRLIRELLKERCCIAVDLQVISDGEEAMSWLLSAPPDRPDFILLDLNLPLVDGRELLSTLKSHSRWKHIPVIVLTSSTEEEDIVQAYRLHCNSYISKPVALEDFARVIATLGDYWFRTATLPSRIAAGR